MKSIVVTLGNWGGTAIFLVNVTKRGWTLTKRLKGLKPFFIFLKVTKTQLRHHHSVTTRFPLVIGGKAGMQAKSVNPRPWAFQDQEQWPPDERSKQELPSNLQMNHHLSSSTQLVHLQAKEKGVMVKGDISGLSWVAPYGFMKKKKTT